MGQRLRGHAPPAEAVCEESVIAIEPDESARILIRHCRDMKQQETRLRGVTLLLLLSCTLLFVFNTAAAGLSRRENSSAVEQSPAYSKQTQEPCPANPPSSSTNPQRLYIHLMSKPTDNRGDGIYINWNVILGEKYDKQKNATVIAERGFYFVYVTFLLNCHDDGHGTEVQESRRFIVEVHKWNERYNEDVKLMEAWDDVACTPHGSRSVFLGDLFELWEGDHVKVWIGEGYNLITSTTFGAFRT